MSYGNALIKSIFDRSPYFFKVCVASSYGLLQRHHRYGKYFHEEVKLLTESQYWSKERLLEYQMERLFHFFQEIQDKIPHYSRSQEYYNLSDKIDRIKEMPVIPKQYVKLHPKDFYNPTSKNVTWGHTSGTTGSALVFPISEEAFQKEYAFRHMHYNWGGVNLIGREKIAMCSGHPVAWHKRDKPPFWSVDLVNNHLFFSSYHMSDQNLKYYIKKLEDFDPQMLHGYPSSIYLLALCYRKYGKKKLSLKSVYTSSETLLDFQRKNIEEIFQVKVYNWYGTSEMSANIVECEKGELHLKSEHSFVEILNDSDQPAGPGGKGRLVSTNFNNTAFPLIRYDIGDYVTISSDQISKCGRSGLLIDSVEGRVEDYIFTPDGRMVGRLDHLFKDAIHVSEAQVEQQNPGEIILRIVKGDGYSDKDEKMILKEARMRLGESINITFDYVSKIPRSSNGKFRFILSKINNAGIPVI